VLLNIRVVLLPYFRVLVHNTNALDYTLAAILSIVNEENEIHPVSFHFCTFTMVELNYDIYNKKLLAIFKAFKIWQPLVTKTNRNTNNRSLSRISSGNHKRTQQGVSAELLPYLYKLHMVHATNNYSCPNVHVSSMSTLCVHYEVAMQLTHSLMLFI